MANQLIDLLDAYTKAKGSTTTSTTQSNVSAAGVDGLIKQILASNQGLASVASGQRSAGLYNSSTNQMLVNDLLSQTASKVAAATAGETKTTKTSGAVGKGDAKNALLLMMGKSLLGPTIAGYSKKNGLDLDKPLGEHIADFLGQGDSPVGDFSASDAYSSSLTDLGNAGRDAFAGIFSDVGSDIAKDTAGDAGTDVLGDFIAGLGL
jgi:hypothetical protein